MFHPPQVSPQLFAPTIAVLRISYRILYSYGRLDPEFKFGEDADREALSRPLDELRAQIRKSAVLQSSKLVSISALLLEVSKLELLVMSLPDGQEMAKVVDAAKNIVKGVFSLISLNPAGFKQVLTGVVGAATVGIKRAQRMHARHLVENLLETMECGRGIQRKLRNESGCKQMEWCLEKDASGAHAFLEPVSTLYSKNIAECVAGAENGAEASLSKSEC